MHYKCDTCGKISDLLPELQSGSGDDESADAKPPSKYAAQIAQLHMHSLDSPVTAATTPAAGDVKPAGGSKVSNAESEGGAQDSPQSQDAAGPVSTAPIEPQIQAPPEETTPRQVDEVAVAPVAAVQVATATSARTREPSSVDTFLHYLTVACVVALLALVYKKALKMQGVLQ